MDRHYITNIEGENHYHPKCVKLNNRRNRMSITINDLEQSVKHLNEITDNPQFRINNGKDGLIYGVGSYFIEGAYGGYQLFQVSNECGGVRECLGTGYTSKKELYYAIKYFKQGYYEGKRK